MESNRWWEFYFVRYFVGSVFGSLVVMALAFHPDSSLSLVIANLFNFSSKDLLELKSDHFWVILSFGVAFCYIASAPILVMHALRAQFDFQSGIYTSWKGWIFRIFLVVIPFALLYFIFKEQTVKFALLGAYTFVVVFQLVFLGPALLSKFDSIFVFYKELAKNRAKDAAERKQYIESYKHLREHGNAFLILFCELVLGSALFVSKSLSEALIVLIIWLSPTIPVWFLGTFLESKVKNI
jgi:hypothetical protein